MHTIWLILKDTPTPDFLALVVAFQTMAVSVGVPLTYSFASSLSNRYKSDIVVNLFHKHSKTGWLVVILLFSICSSVLLRFLVDTPYRWYWILFAWLIFGLFIFSLLCVGLYFWSLKKYMSSRSILSLLKNDAEEALRADNITNDQRRKMLVSSVEGMGDVLAHETKRKNRNDCVYEGLDNLENIINSIFEMRKSNEERHESLICSEEFLELRDTDKNEAGARLHFLPERCLPTFKILIDQFFRVNEVAMSCGNVDASKQAQIRWTRLLLFLTRKKGNITFVSLLLGGMSLQAKKDLREDGQDEDSFWPVWFKMVLFLEGEKLEMLYLQELCNYFRWQQQYLIDNDGFQSFKEAFYFMHHGAPTMSCWPPSVSMFVQKKGFFPERHNIGDLGSKIRKLDSTASYLNDTDSLDKWIRDFDALFNDLLSNSNLNKKQKSEVDKAAEAIRCEAYSVMKFNLVRIVYFELGAYCLFKKKMEYIPYMWQWHSPPDNRSNWLPAPIIPVDKGELINIYFSRQINHKSHFPWEGHHGSEVYLQRYFLLSLFHLLRKQNENTPILKHQDRYYYSNVERECGELIKEVGRLRKDPELLQSLDLLVPNLDIEINTRLLPFLKYIKKTANEELEKLR
jgi:hypothetical protein